jgi:hypothetical protein
MSSTPTSVNSHCKKVGTLCHTGAYQQNRTFEPPLMDNFSAKCIFVQSGFRQQPIKSSKHFVLHLVTALCHFSPYSPPPRILATLNTALFEEGKCVPAERRVEADIETTYP